MDTDAIVQIVHLVNHANVLIANMGNPIQRMGDANSGGGVIDSIPQGTVKANSLVVSIDGSKGTGHGVGIHSYHAWDTANGSSIVRIGGTPINRTGDADTCTHARVGGSSNVNVGDKSS